MSTIPPPVGVALELTAPLTIGRRRQVLVATSASWFLFGVCVLGLAPVYPDIAHTLALNPAAMGAVLGIATLVSGALQIPSGMLADRFPLRYIVIVGLVSAAVTPLLWSAAGDYRLYALGQVTLGIAIVALQSGCFSALIAAYPVNRRAAALSSMWAAVNLGQGVSLLLFGFLGGQFGWRAVALAIAWVPLAAIPLVFFMPTSRSTVAETSFAIQVKESGAYLMHGTAVGIAAISALSAAAVVGMQFLLPFVLRGSSFGTAATGLLLVPLIVGGVIGSPLLGTMADRFGPAPVLISGLPLGAFAVGVMVAVGPQPVVLVICLVLIGALSNGGQAITISLTAHYAEFIGGIGTGAALGVTRLAQSLGPAVAPSIGGYLFSHVGAPGAEVAIGSLFVVAAAVALAILPRLKSRTLGA